ncbi:hypothetical protein [Neisseria lactamica]|nr:hypothetical protein [Neisseria lactamica]
MFAVFGKCRPEEEKRRRLVYNKDDSTWYEDRRKWTANLISLMHRGAAA